MLHMKRKFSNIFLFILGHNEMGEVKVMYTLVYVIWNTFLQYKIRPNNILSEKYYKQQKE